MLAPHNNSGSLQTSAEQSNSSWQVVRPTAAYPSRWAAASATLPLSAAIMEWHESQSAPSLCRRRKYVANALHLARTSAWIRGARSGDEAVR